MLDFEMSSRIKWEYFIQNSNLLEFLCKCFIKIKISMVRKKVQPIVRILNGSTSINYNHFRPSHLSLISSSWELQRIKREANINQPNLSIIDNFEVLRRRYLDTLRDRRRSGTRRPRGQRNQIAENQDFLESVGWERWDVVTCWHDPDWNLL